MSRLYIFNFKLESYFSIVSLMGVSLMSCAWLIKFILNPDPRVKTIGFILLGLGILLPLLALKLNKEWRLRISMSMLGSLLGLYSFEYFLVISDLHSQNIINTKKDKMTSSFDQLMDEGKQPSIPASTLSLVKIISGSAYGSIATEPGPLLPLSNASKRNVLLCDASDGPIVFQSDRYGFNNRNEIWDANEIEVAFLGDSFVEGVCVLREENICSEVIKTYPATLNLGIVGHGPLAMLGSIKEYLTGIKPKVVVWCFVSNDLYPNLSLEKGNQFLMNYLKDGFSQNLINKQNEIDLIMQNFIQLTRKKSFTNSDKNLNSDIPNTVKNLANSKFTRLYRVRQKVLRQFLAKANSDISLFEQILSEANKSVNSWGGKIIFVYMPTAERFYKNQQNPLKKNILDIVKIKKIEIVDLETVFQNDANPKRFFDNANAHYNATGYATASKAILKNIDSIK